MPGTATVLGPAPPPHATPGFCTVCAGLAKAALAPSFPEIAEHEAHGSGDRAWPLPATARPALAVAWCPVPQLGGVVLPVCWTHLLAFDARGSALMPASPAETAALAANPGVPLLGGPR